MKKMKVAYLRVSTEEQRKQQTIEMQRTEILRYCKTRGLILDKIYEDNGVTSRRPLDQRPGGRELLQDAEGGLIDEIYIWKVDRLSRNLRWFLNDLDALERLGIKIIATTQPIPDGPTGQLMRQMLGAFAELDRAQIQEKTGAGLRGRAERVGYAGGPVPFGYRKVVSVLSGVPRQENAEEQERWWGRGTFDRTT